MEETSKYIVGLLACSMIVNVWLLVNYKHDVGEEGKLSWSRRAAEEAEGVAAISCSGHGRAYLDGLLLHDDDANRPVCECNSCYGGPDCSQLITHCLVNADGGDPYFLEPFWMKNAESSALLVAGWHRMGYSYSDQTTISQELDAHIRKLHSIVGNAITQDKYLIFGSGSTQLLNAAVHALSSPHNSTSPAMVVASIPFYPVYESQTEMFESEDFKFEGEASLVINNATSSSGEEKRIIEFVTSPNNPDGKLKKSVLSGENAKAVHDHAYYWPHYTPIPAPANEDVMLFTISKLTGHAGTRFGWAVIKDKDVYERMVTYMQLNTIGVSRDAQLRVLKLLKAILENEAREILEFGYKAMSSRWEKLSKTLAQSKRFSLQKIEPMYCNFIQRIRDPSPAYAWLKCEREEDKDCHSVLEAASINGREGSRFSAEDRYVRLSLIRSQDDFDLLLHQLNKLVSAEDGAKNM